MKRRHYSQSGDPTLGNRSGVVLVNLIPGEAAPPDLKPGQVRCRVCRQATTLTTTGVYRSHRDLFGNPCGARSPQAIVKLDVVPDVILPPEPKYVTPTKGEATEREKGSGVRAWGNCEECDAFVSGERRFCGKCLVRRERDRKRKR